jgi:mycoredoxin
MTEPRSPIVVYGHPGCPMVYPVRRLLDEQAVAYDYVNIYQDLDARVRVREINRGYESVPTLVFPDGSTLTEPSLSTLRRSLQAKGYLVEGGDRGGPLSAASGHPLIVPALILLAAAAGVALLSWLT